MATFRCMSGHVFSSSQRVPECPVCGARMCAPIASLSSGHAPHDEAPQELPKTSAQRQSSIAVWVVLAVVVGMGIAAAGVSFALRVGQQRSALPPQIERCDDCGTPLQELRNSQTLCQNCLRQRSDSAAADREVREKQSSRVAREQGEAEERRLNERVQVVTAITCQRCGKTIRQETAVMTRREAGADTTRTFPQGYCSNGCRIAAAAANTSEKAGEVIGENADRFLDGVMRGVNR